MGGLAVFVFGIVLPEAKAGLGETAEPPTATGGSLVSKQEGKVG